LVASPKEQFWIISATFVKAVKIAFISQFLSILFAKVRFGHG
jgi:hypothetical protein